MSGSYRAFFVRGQPRQLIAGLGFAWLSFGMVDLAIFLTVQRTAGSYGRAGIAVAGFSLGAGALAPLRGRLLDRRGVRPWLIVLAAGHAGALLAIAALAQTNASAWLLIGLAAAGGASAPPLVASVRALWALVVEQTLVRRAYALTSIVGDVGMVAAPALAGLLFVAVSWLPLLICGLSALGAAVMVTRNAPRRGRQAPATSGKARLLTRGLVVLIAVEVALGMALGLVAVAVPAAATSWGATAYSGLPLAAFALGSVLGGIWFGRRQWKAPPERRYVLASLLLGITLLPPIATTSVHTLAPLLLIAGLSYGPATISLFEALDNLATSRATEAFTWMTSSGAIGAAAGNAAAGWTTTNIGLWAVFAAASTILGIAAISGLIQDTLWRSAERQ